jgi:hypothetical protein
MWQPAVRRVCRATYARTLPPQRLWMALRSHAADVFDAMLEVAKARDLAVES